MAAIDLITVPDLKAYAPKAGSGRDRALGGFITAASRWIEEEIGRRLRFRAPAEVEGGANIVAPVAFATNPGLTLAGQPNAAGRVLVVTLTDSDYSVTAGLVTVTGTVGGVPGVTETFDFSTGGLEQYGMKFFEAIASIAVTGVAGAAAADMLKIGTSLGYVEYHSPYTGTAELATLEWPIPTGGLLEVNEDPAGVYSSTTRLAQGTDYVLEHRKDGDYLVRVSSSQPFAWMAGWRAEKLVMAAGYKMATVPADAKDVCRRLVILLEDEVSRGRVGILTTNDALGNWTRFGPSMLTREMREQLAALRRFRFGSDTGQADFDLEAA